MTLEKGSARAKRIGSSIATYRKIRVKYEPQSELINSMDELRNIGLETKGELQEVLVVLEDTFAGKSSAASMFKQFVEGQLPPGSTDRPIVVATASAGCSPRALVVSLLQGLGTRFAPGMTEGAMWKLWPDACLRYRVQMAMIDEVQHTQDGKFSDGVINTLKNQLAINVPLVVLGTRKAASLLTPNDGFNSRIYDTVSLRPMVWGETADELIWTKLCKDLDGAMKKAKIVNPGGRLVNYAEPLCRASLGRIGLLKKIVQTALRLALRRGSSSIDVIDLEKSVDVWSIRHGYTQDNLFRSIGRVGR